MNVSKKTESIKCHQAPGGNSSFAFSYSDNSSVTKSTSQKFSSNVFSNENCNTTNYKSESIKTSYGKQGNLNIFGESNYDQKQPSIKVTAAPGGGSNIVFGNDSSNYEEYRRKK
jgi:hypothetical protein